MAISMFVHSGRTTDRLSGASFFTLSPEIVDMPLDATLDAEIDGDARFSFRVVNTGTTAITLTFSSGKRADIVVENESGETVWRWSDGRMFTQAITRATLEPGEQIEESFTWSDPPPGRYVATGTLEADAELDAQTELSV